MFEQVIMFCERYIGSDNTNFQNAVEDLANLCDAVYDWENWYELYVEGK